MQQDIDAQSDQFYLQYFFPPSSVGETGRVGGMPGRREVGHGMLAQRALAPTVPSEVSCYAHYTPRAAVHRWYACCCAVNVILQLHKALVPITPSEVCCAGHSSLNALPTVVVSAAVYLSAGTCPGQRSQSVNDNGL